jgi:hypothetical protein
VNTHSQRCNGAVQNASVPKIRLSRVKKGVLNRHIFMMPYKLPALFIALSGSQTTLRIRLAASAVATLTASLDGGRLSEHTSSCGGKA